MSELRSRAPGRFGLLVVGEGPVRESLEARTRELKLQDDVHFTGWMDYSKLPDLIQRSQIGMLPFHRCAHIEASLANKMFEYMSLGLPVIASDVAPQRRVLEDAQNGKLFPPGDVKALAEAILELTSDPAQLRQHSENGKTAPRTKYNWEQDSAELLRVIARVGAAAPQELGAEGALRQV